MSENGQLVIKLVREVAAQQPDYVYHGDSGRCTYVRREADRIVPDCLVGHALWNAGLIDESYYDTNNRVEIHALSDEFGFDPDEVKWLQSLQYCQDCRITWGNSVLKTDLETVGNRANNLYAARALVRQFLAQGQPIAHGLPAL